MDAQGRTSVDKKQDDLARASLQRVESYREMSESFAQQVADQKAQVENLKVGPAPTGAEAGRGAGQGRSADRATSPRPRRGQGQRRASRDGRWLESRSLRPDEAQSGALGSDRQAKSEIASDNMEDRLAALEKEDRIEQLLAELKGRRGA